MSGGLGSFGRPRYAFSERRVKRKTDRGFYSQLNGAGGLGAYLLRRILNASCWGWGT